MEPQQDLTKWMKMTKYQATPFQQISPHEVGQKFKSGTFNPGKGSPYAGNQRSI